jgi:hypothetical protein
MYSFKYNQQDVTYIIFFIIVNALHISGGFPSIIRSSRTVHSIWNVLGLLAATASGGSKQAMGSNPSTPAVDSRKALQYPRPHIQFYKLLTMGGKTARNM